MDSHKCQNQRKPHKDIDGGWAWLVLIGVTYWNMLLGGTLKCFGILYVEFLDLYQAGPTRTSWIISCFAFSTMFPGLVTGYTSDRIDTRKVNMIIAFLLSLSFAATAFAPNLAVTIVTHGLLAGLLSGMIDAPFLGTLNKYFIQNRDFVNGIAFSGDSVGSLILPFIMTWAISQYSVRGAMFIIASLWMQAVLIAAVAKTTPPWTRRQNEKSSSSRDAPSSTTCSTDLRPNHSKLNGTDKDVRPCSLVRGLSDEAELGSLTNSHGVNLKDSAAVGSRLIPAYPKMWRGLSLLVADLRDCCSIMNSLLLLQITACVLSSMAFVGQLNVWPAHAEEIHLSKNDAALLLSICGLAEVISRPTIGYLCSRLNLNKAFLLASFGLIAAAIGIPVTFSTSKWIWCVYAFLYGIFGGAFVAITVAMMVEIAGWRRSGSISAMFVFSFGLGSSIAPPLLGLVKEATGLYVYSIRLCLLLYIPAGLLLFISGILSRWRPRKPLDMVLESKEVHPD